MSGALPALLAWISLRREFLVFTIVRLGGLALKPLIILTATFSGRVEFAEDYALLISALASLFVLTGGQIHRSYYNRRFGEGRRSYRHAFERYFGDSLIQYLSMLPLVALMALAWTQNPALIAAVIVLVGVEKFLDEEQRHFLFTREYARWSLAFAARLVLPALLTLVAIWVFPGPLTLFYVTASVGSFVLYLVIRQRHSILHLRLLGRQVQALANRGREVLRGFFQRWHLDYVFSQIWSFLAVNVYLVDRLWVANQPEMRLDNYVFFATIFNLGAQLHSLFYFTPRRPILIQSQSRSAGRELVRTPNLVLPLLLLGGSLGLAIALRALIPQYHTVPLLLLVGMSVYFALQASGLVVTETVFWRASRKLMMLVDLAVIAFAFTLFIALDPPLWALPWIAAAAALLRLITYILLSARASRSALAREQAADETISPEMP